MNPIIKNQLDKIRCAKMPDYDEDTTHLYIPMKTLNDTIVLEQDKCYIVMVEDYILNPPDDFSLHINWNGGTKPSHKYMKLDVSKISGKMVKVNTIGYDIENKVDIPDLWSGWLPEQSITVLERL
jgi:hypothetical protein